MREDMRVGYKKKRMDKGVEHKSRKIRMRRGEGKNKMKGDKSR